MSVGHLQLRRQGDRPGRLHLDRALRPSQTRLLPRLFERVDVFGEQAGRAAGNRTASCGDPVAARHGVDGDVDQQRASAADEVGADAAGRQLDQVRQACAVRRRRSRRPRAPTFPATIRCRWPRRSHSLHQQYSPHAPHALVCGTGRSRHHARSGRPLVAMCAAAVLAAGCTHDHRAAPRLGPLPASTTNPGRRSMSSR